MKKPKFFILRIFGALFLISGGFIIWENGITFPSEPFKIGNIEVPLPIELLLILFGSWLLLHPISFLQAIIFIIPKTKEERLEKYIEDQRVKPSKLLTKDSSPSEIAEIINRHIRTSNIRFFINIFFISIIVVFLILALPYINSNVSSGANFTRESNRLINLVQRSRIDFSYVNHFRIFLNETESTIVSSSKEKTSTRHIFDILKKLNDPSVKDREAFDRKVTQIYEEKIKPLVIMNPGILDVDKLKLPQSSKESPDANSTFLTLLATICNLQGDYGTYLMPYLQGRQILNIITEQKYPNPLPATSNAIGVNYAGFLKCYDDLKETFKTTTIKSIFPGDELPSRLSLAISAIQEYKTAVEKSESNFIRARALNNEVDLLINLLFMIQVEHTPIENEIQYESDRLFLIEQLAAPVSMISNWKPGLLIPVFDELNKKLDEALSLSREPEIFFTKAQLYSISGKLCELNNIQGQFWGNEKYIAKAALTNLEIASSMRLPKRFFEESYASRFYLNWLWEQT